MDEVKAVFRTFILAAILIACTQIQVEQTTIESKIRNWLVSEPVAQFVNQSAQGGAKFLKESFAWIKQEWKAQNKKTDEVGGRASPVQEQNLIYRSEVTSENISNE